MFGALRTHRAWRFVLRTPSTVSYRFRCDVRRALCLALVPFACTSALPWSLNSTENDAVCTAPGNQHDPRLISDGAGGAIIGWSDFRNGPISSIYAQRVESTGMVKWTPNGVAVSTGDGYYPRLVSDGSGGAIITWQDERSGATSDDIYAQRIDANGSVLWTVDGVAICTAAAEQDNPQLISDGAGGAIITWEDYRGGSNADIYAQRISSTGSVQWTTNGTPICTATGWQRDAKIVNGDAGFAIIAWSDERVTSNWDIFAQCIDSSGATLWTTNGVAVCAAAGHQWSCEATGDGSGGACISWFDQRGPDTDVFAQRIDSSGITLWTANGVPVCTAAGDQWFPSLIGDGSGGAIITWEVLGTGSYLDWVYIQRVDASGTPQWGANGKAICPISGNQGGPKLLSAPAGGAIIAWQDMRSGNDAIYAQQIDISGTVQWTSNGVAISTASGWKVAPYLSSDGSGGAIVTWMDNRNGNLDVFAQHVSSEGFLPVSLSRFGLE